MGMFKRLPIGLLLLTILSVVLLIAALGTVFLYAPVEATMGLVQKVFYFHVAHAWAGMLSFIVAAITGAVYLKMRDLRWDVASLASVELGMVLMLIAIVSGSIWAHAAWNTWWTWDPRLTTVTIMELLYAAYLMLRQGIAEPERRARFGAIYVIVAVLTVPLTFFSIRFYRTIHPVIIGDSDPSAAGAFDMTPRMLHTFFFSLITFSVIFATLFWYRLRLGLLAKRVSEKRMELED